LNYDHLNYNTYRATKSYDYLTHERICIYKLYYKITTIIVTINIIGDISFDVSDNISDTIILTHFDTYSFQELSSFPNL